MPRIFIALVFTILNSRGLMPLKPKEYSQALNYEGTQDKPLFKICGTN